MKQAFETLLVRERDVPTGSKIIVAGDSASQKKGAEIIKIIEDSLFWHTILRFAIDQYEIKLILIHLLLELSSILNLSHLLQILHKQCIVALMKFSSPLAF